MWSGSLRSSAGDQLKCIPQTPEDAGSREAGSNFGGSGEGGEYGFRVKKHLGEVYEGKNMFVVMVTGSVVCSKNISLG